MIHPNSKGWFPVCIVCGNGNLDEVVCLNPACHDNYLLKSIDPGKNSEGVSNEVIMKDGQYWKLCKLCSKPILSSPGSWGSYAICYKCFNIFNNIHIDPPRYPIDLHEMLSSGIIKYIIVNDRREIVIDETKI